MKEKAFDEIVKILNNKQPMIQQLRDIEDVVAREKGDWLKDRVQEHIEEILK